jgi:predicted dithiol-disulfide oxidoreductase (DUF899 family)
MVRLFSVLAAHHDEEADIAKPRIDYNFGTIVTDPRYVSRELPGVSVFCKNEAGEVFHTMRAVSTCCLARVIHPRIETMINRHF